MLSSELEPLLCSQDKCCRFIGPVSTNREDAPLLIKPSVRSSQCIFLTLSILSFCHLLCFWWFISPPLSPSFFLLLPLFLSIHFLSFFPKMLFHLSLSLSTSVPPQHPVIQGLDREGPVKRGTMLKLVCVSQGGNPLATLHWTKVQRLHSAKAYNQ